AFHGDVVAVAKRDLSVGETLDGEGGYTVYGRLMRAADSLVHGALPIGLAHGVVLTRPVTAGDVVHWADVRLDASVEAVRVRREMEAAFAREQELLRDTAGTPGAPGSSPTYGREEERTHRSGPETRQSL